MKCQKLHEDKQLNFDAVKRTIKQNISFKFIVHHEGLHTFWSKYEKNNELQN